MKITTAAGDDQIPGHSQHLNSNDKETERRAKRAAQTRLRRANETDEERSKRLGDMAARKRQRLSINGDQVLQNTQSKIQMQQERRTRENSEQRQLQLTNDITRRRNRLRNENITYVNEFKQMSQG